MEFKKLAERLMRARGLREGPDFDRGLVRKLKEEAVVLEKSVERIIHLNGLLSDEDLDRATTQLSDAFSEVEDAIFNLEQESRP